MLSARCPCGEMGSRNCWVRYESILHRIPIVDGVPNCIDFLLQLFNPLAKVFNGVNIRIFGDRFVFFVGFTHWSSGREVVGVLEIFGEKSLQLPYSLSMFLDEIWQLFDVSSNDASLIAMIWDTNFPYYFAKALVRAV